MYDNANGAISGAVDADGQETTEYTYANGYSYKTQQLDYNAVRRVHRRGLLPAGGLPSAGLGAGFEFTSTYEGIDGELTKQSFPSGGGLPAETVTYSSTSALDLPAAVGSTLAGYAEGTTYYSNGLPDQVTLGAGSDEAFVTDTYDARTNDLTGQKVTNDARHRPRRRHLRVRRGRGAHVGDRRAERVHLAGGDPVLRQHSQRAAVAGVDRDRRVRGHPDHVQPLHRR